MTTTTIKRQFGVAVLLKISGVDAEDDGGHLRFDSQAAVDGVMYAVDRFGIRLQLDRARPIGRCRRNER